jgi:D-alanyl-D-alanine carboxypeptidase
VKALCRARRVAVATLACAAASLLVGAAGSASRGIPPVAAVAQELARGGATSVIVLVSDRGHDFVATAGASHPRPSQRFRIGSITKTFTASLVMQLVDQHGLRLNDTMARYLPGVVPDGANITIRDLLQHESGLANFTDYGSWLAKADSSRSLRPIDTLRFAASQPLLFRPGTQWSYSNTNYIALGLIIEKVTGRSFRTELTQRILRPLKLTATELPATRTLPYLHDVGYNPQLAWAAGAIVSDAEDLSRFFAALLSGRIFSKAAVARMEQAVPANTVFGLWQADGLGIFSSRLRCGHFWGHDGAILDYATIVEASPGRRVAVVSFRTATLAQPNMLPLLCS